jgi:GNAT superfamily N-acetyltransferase
MGNTGTHVGGQSIRRYQEGDELAVADVWHRSGQARYTFLPTWQALSLDTARKVFREVIRPKCDIWVGIRGDQIVAYLAMNGSSIDRLYVDPSEWRRGWGTRFIELAKKLSPGGLETRTHQQNAGARACYEKHGFTAVKFGISPPPECAPDVEYHWRPANSALQRTRKKRRAVERGR